MDVARQSAPVQSVRKAMDLLDRVAFASPAQRPTLTQLAGEMGLRTNTAHNLLKSLEACGYVGREAGGYAPGYKLRQMGLMNRATSPEASRRIRAVLADLAEQVGELVLYAVLSGHRRITLAYVDGAPDAGIHRQPDLAPSIYAVPTGRLLLACAPPEQRQEIIEALGLPEAQHWEGMRTRRKLDAALDAIAERGFCIQSTAAGRYASFAVGVPDAADGLAGSLGCMAAAADWPPSRHDEMLAALTAAAKRLAAVV